MTLHEEKVDGNSEGRGDGIKKTGPTSYLHNLNKDQLEAVTHIHGPLLIVAGAGAGKTKTITHRIIHLLKSGVPGRQILAITFTNKAAREMRERTRALLSQDLELKTLVARDGEPFLSTFHSLGVFLLKEYGNRLGISRYFSIFDKGDSKRAIKEALTLAQYDPKQYDPAKIAGAISKAKGEGLSVEKYREEKGIAGDGKNSVGGGSASGMGGGFFEKVVAAVWHKYEEILRTENALDFDDLLLKTLTLLEKHADIRLACQKRWTHIHIDEYQDTNTVQDRIAELIAGEQKNICVVGDTDQNIYSWRGARIHNMLNFEKKYPGVRTVRLEENYRSTKTILSVANAIIAKNKFRIDKTLFTNNEEGSKITLISNYDEAQEAYTVAEKILSLVRAGVHESEIAVLYRANFQSRILEEACVALGVPYQMIGVKFFERKEIKDTLSYIRAALNPASLSDVRRIINVPARGIGKATIEKVVSGKEAELSAAAKKKVVEFRTLLERIKDACARLKTSELIKYVIEETGIEDSLERGGEEGDERLENIAELVTLALGYDDYAAPEGIDRLLTDAALATDEESTNNTPDTSGEGQKEAVKLMTVHAAKGLEFDHVFITGLEEGLFPHERRHEGRSTGAPEDLEEERRLFYVAITRARKKLYLSYTHMRTIFGSRQVNIPSEFVFDIEDKHIEREEGTGGAISRKPLFRIDF